MKKKRRMKKILVWVLGVIWLGMLPAQNDGLAKARLKVYQGYLTNDIQSWNQGIKDLESMVANDQRFETLLELILAQYGMVGYCIGQEACEDIDEQIDQVEENLKTLLKLTPSSSEGHALMGAILAMKIGRNPAKAIFLGPSSNKHIQKATKFDSSCPFAWAEMGNMRFHAPRLFGGNIDEAISSFQKAIAAFDQQPTLKKHNWVYLHCHAWLGKAYEEKELYDKAAATYRNLLVIAPDFQWAKKELLPAVLKKSK